MIKVAEKFSVSGSYMARVCSVLNVPRPERRYWAKLEVGKAPARPTLPEALLGDQLFWSQEGNPPAPQLRAFTATSAQAQPRARRVVTGIHGLIQGAKQHYERGYKVEEGQLLRPCKRQLVDVRLAHLAGVRYVMFTTKDHSGFAMFDTKTTQFGIMNTPFHRDITKEVFDAFRAQGIAAGVYYSPEDFWWLHQPNKTIERSVPDIQPRNNPGLMQYDQAQLREPHYGKIDALFLDGEAVGLRDLAWELDPDIIVTRGAIKTPELTVPGMPLPGAWETCMTMGTAWQYQPQSQHYKPGGELIRLLIQTRAA